MSGSAVTTNKMAATTITNIQAPKTLKCFAITIATRPTHGASRTAVMEVIATISSWEIDIPLTLIEMPGLSATATWAKRAAATAVIEAKNIVLLITQTSQCEQHSLEHKSPHAACISTNMTAQNDKKSVMAPLSTDRPKILYVTTHHLRGWQSKGSAFLGRPRRRQPECNPDVSPGNDHKRTFAIKKQLCNMSVNATTTYCTTNYRATTRRQLSFHVNQKTAKSSCKLCPKLYTWWNSSLRQTRDKVITKLEIEDTWDKKNNNLRYQIVRQNRMDQKNHQDQHNRENWLTSHDNTQPTVNRKNLYRSEFKQTYLQQHSDTTPPRSSFLVCDNTKWLTCVSNTSNNENTITWEVSHRRKSTVGCRNCFENSFRMIWQTLNSNYQNNRPGVQLNNCNKKRS